jgi:hypothetical protein
MGLKYILPNFYNSFANNLHLFKKLMKRKNICGISGTFPFSIFYGSYNNIPYEDICLHRDIVSITENYDLLSDMIIIDYGNTLLELFDYYDLFNAVVLDEYANNDNFYFSVAQKGLIDFLIKKYPKINIILHQNYTRGNTSEVIQELINQYPNNIKGIVTSSFNICSKVENVFKIYLTPIHTCEECVHYVKCLNHDNNAVLEYSNKSRFNECKIRELANPQIIADRINHLKTKCDYIMFDTVACARQEEEYNIIEQVLNKMEE